jgi:hypothetical protein
MQTSDELSGRTPAEFVETLILTQILAASRTLVEVDGDRDVETLPRVQPFAALRGRLGSSLHLAQTSRQILARRART